jgi:hypothetical protein
MISCSVPRTQTHLLRQPPEVPRQIAGDDGRAGHLLLSIHHHAHLMR